MTILLTLFSLNCLADNNIPTQSNDKGFVQLAFYSSQPHYDYYDKATDNIASSCKGIETTNIIEHDIEYVEHTHKTKFLGVDMEYISLIKNLTSFLLLGIK